MAGVVAEVCPAVAVPSGSGVCCSTKCSLHTEKGGVSPLCLSERPVLSISSTGRGFAVEERPLLASACPTDARVSIHPPACMLAANRTPQRPSPPHGALEIEQSHYTASPRCSFWPWRAQQTQQQPRAHHRVGQHVLPDAGHCASFGRTIHLPLSCGAVQWLY